MDLSSPVGADAPKPRTEGNRLDDASSAASVLSKAHLVLGAFAGGKSPLGLTELSRRSGVAKATAHRLASELVDLGYLARTARGYELGWRIFELGQLVPGPAGLSAAARPVLLDLRTETKAIAVHLAVPHGSEVVFLERLAGFREIGIVSKIGERAPSEFSASGRLFLAFAEETHCRRSTNPAASAEGRRRPDAISDADLRTIRANRWACEREEVVTGMKTFAVPVEGTGYPMAAAISASIRADRRDERNLIYALRIAAADIHRSLLAQPARGHHGTRRRVVPLAG